MMMLDILLDADGAAQAVVAVSLLDGSAHVFCGQSIILATGGYHWAKGVSAGSPESTGDAHAALLRRGLPFRDMEFPQYDFTGIRPFASKPDVDGDMFEIAYAFGVNGEVWQRFLDRSKRPFVSPEPVAAEQKSSLGMFQDTMTAAARQLYARRGTVGDGSGNGLLFNLVDIMDDPSHLPYPTYKGFINDVEHNMDFDFPDYCEVIANEYSSCGSPWVNPATAESRIPRLYLVFVGISAMSTTFAWSMAVMAAIDATAKLAASLAAPDRRCHAAAPASPGHAAAPPQAQRQAQGHPAPAHAPPINQDELQQVLARAYRPLEASPHRSHNGIRSTEVFRRIQRCFYKGYGFLKDESSMKAALQELQRIESEDLPRVCCADSSLVFNRDWRLAMEAGNILTCSSASLAAGLCRRESRSPFFRADYPKMDNQRFLCSLWTSIKPGGGWQVEKGDIVCSVMPAQEIAAALGTQDISGMEPGS
jgi:succinate dehydrogenase/fumarate reductase flavoprotein subunit